MGQELRPTRLSAAITAAARRRWEAGSELRSRRQRCKRYTYGDQWGDPEIDRETGATVTAGEMMRRKGRTPLTTNLIRRLVRCIVGRFRMMTEEERPDGRLRDLTEANELSELDSRMLEEFIISGCALQRVSRVGGEIRVDNISPARLIISEVNDPRCRDVEMVGMLHDMSLTEVILRYGHGDRTRIEQLRRLYERQPTGDTMRWIGSDDLTDEFAVAAAGRCRVVEVWTLESETSLICHDPEQMKLYRVSVGEQLQIDKENNRRSKTGRAAVATRTDVRVVWRGRWMAPDGTVLAECVADRHPFVVKLYPLTDGEVHSLVEDVIEQQQYINRLISLIDHILGSSAKGALLFPVQQKLPKVSWEDIARRWSAPDGVIPISGIPGMAEPRQVAGSGSDAGAKELLQLQMRMFEDVSGVSNALMGKSSSGGNVGVERYEAEVKNATISILDLLRSFDHFRNQRDRLMIAIDGKK